MAPISDSPPAETKETEQQEQIKLIEWAGSGTAGRVTQRNQANITAKRLMSIMANIQWVLLPAGLSEGSDLPSFSSSSASRTQQLGAPPGAENIEGRRTIREGQSPSVPSSNSPLPSGLPLGDVPLLRVKREGSTDRFTEQAETEFQLIDEEFTSMWWQEEETGGQLKHVWVGKEGD